MKKEEKKGRIIDGEYNGWYVKAEPDEKTGGIYLFLCCNEDCKGEIGEGFDYWFLSDREMYGTIDLNEWKIKWD